MRIYCGKLTRNYLELKYYFYKNNISKIIFNSFEFFESNES